MDYQHRDNNRRLVWSRVSISINHCLQSGRHASDQLFQPFLGNRISCSVHCCLQCLWIAHPPQICPSSTSMSPHNASIELRSGDCAGHGSTSIPFNSRYLLACPLWPGAPSSTTTAHLNSSQHPCHRGTKRGIPWTAPLSGQTLLSMHRPFPRRFLPRRGVGFFDLG